MARSATGRGASRSARSASRHSLARTACSQRPPAASTYSNIFGSAGPAARTARPRVGSSAALSALRVQTPPTKISVGPVNGRVVFSRWFNCRDELLPRPSAPITTPESKRREWRARQHAKDFEARMAHVLCACISRRLMCCCFENLYDTISLNCTPPIHECMTSSAGTKSPSGFKWAANVLFE